MSPSRGPGFVAGALVGGLVGGALGVLLAPRSGEQTRRELRQRGAVVRSGKASGPSSEAGGIVAGVLAAAQDRLETAVAEARAAAAEARRGLAEEWASRKEGRPDPHSN